MMLQQRSSSYSYFFELRRSMSQEEVLLFDISNRGRLRMTGEDRIRFLSGQVTNDVKSLATNTGCYAALTNAKGKMRADMVILNLGTEFLIEVEPGLEKTVSESLEKYIVADDVQIDVVTQNWRAFSVVGSAAVDFLQTSKLCANPPVKVYEIVPLNLGGLRSVEASQKALTEQRPPQDGFLFRTFRAQIDSFDIWVESSQASMFLEKLQQAGCKTGTEAELEILRIEAGIPKFGVEMDENTIPSEAGLETRAISYTKGCYIGQEVIARIKSVGHVNRQLAKLKFKETPEKGAPLLFQDKEVGKVSSVVDSPRFGCIGLAIVRREAASNGSVLKHSQGEAIVVEKFADV
jgi:tRNA-modifying protein YgfZ